jgi:DNA excision repair protein ERCC-8
MNSFLLNRSLASITPTSLARAQTASLLHAIQPAPNIQFLSDDSSSERLNATTHHADNADGEQPRTHKAGVNALAIDRFEGR